MKKLCNLRGLTDEKLPDLCCFSRLSAAETGFLDLRGGQKFCAGSERDDTAGLQNIAEVGYVEGSLRILLDQKDR